MYGVWHGPESLTTIARRTHRYAALLAKAAGATGAFFDTVRIAVPGGAAEVVRVLTLVHADGEVRVVGRHGAEEDDAAVCVERVESC